jgi:8-oxo-dGTP diphosphatase
MVQRIEYVAGFMFSEDRTHLALIQKKKPEWQRGRFNAIGGKIEPGEGALDAMVREFQEETGVDTTPEVWESLATLTGPGWRVHFFHAFTDSVWDARTTTDEEVFVGAVAGFTANQFLMDNLKVLIPLALDCSGITLPVALFDGMAAKEIDPVRAIPTDPTTGRPSGDHGSAADAIDFALDTSDGLEADTFLRRWREGDLDEWPDFYEWLAERERAVAA